MNQASVLWLVPLIVLEKTCRANDGGEGGMIQFSACESASLDTYSVWSSTGIATERIPYPNQALRQRLCTRVGES